MTSHALLLRLFLSPSFFSVHVALRYLLLYADNIGITYYLTRRLRELEIHELHDVWGFICHLLVTRPTKSRALECFVVETAQRSAHIAMITLWFMQAALHDLSSTRRDSSSFVICQRVLHKCHEIIFGDLPPPAPSPYGSLNLSFQGRNLRRKVKHHAEPAIVGIGVMLAGAPGMPKLTEVTGEIAVEQGRAEEEGDSFRSWEMHDDDLALGNGAVIRGATDVGEDEVDEVESPNTEEESSPAFISQPSQNSNGLLERRRTIGAAQTVPALPLHLRTIRRSRASEDPLGQLDLEDSEAPSRSSPSLSNARTPLRSAAFNPADALLERYDSQTQGQLLRNHYCLSEVKFLLSLESICNRLLVVPKPARVSALRAELTALNHKLPAEVCMPMWCSSSDTPRPPHGITQPHHRIVRIPPGESVVLNSAERAPYLLLIEILNDDLDLDPSKRANKDVLRKIVIKEAERKGAARDLISFATTPSMTTRGRARSNTADDSDVVRGSDVRPPSSVVVMPPTPSTSSLPNEEEEIDLVEQLYGADEPLRSRAVDLSDSIVLPPTPKNKELDMVAWSRTSSSGPSTPEPSSSVPRPPMSRFESSFLYKSPPLPLPPLLPPPVPNNGPESIQDHSRILSLDEYSERMRTAAIMLAQLNANLVREAVVPVGGTPQTPSVQRAGAGGQVEHSQAVHTRMRLQHAEAAAIRDRIMKEMLSLEEERMERMKESRESENIMRIGDLSGSMKSAEDEGIIRRELNKVDPSAVVFSESWAAKKSRIRHASPYGHLANWDCVSVIVKTGGDLRQEQLAVQLIREFQAIWAEENSACWVRYFRILITGGTSGLVETITDAVSIHSIKKAEYAKRLAEGRLGHVTLFDHFKATYGDPSSAKFVRAQRNFAKSLAGYSIVTYLLQVKDRHNGNILLDRDGHLIHIDFGFILSNTPGNIGFEAAPFKLPAEYIEILGGINSAPFLEFRRLFREGFEAARKHCDRIITLVELMQKDSALPCFAASGDQTANQLRDRFQPTLTHSLVGDYVDRLIDSSLGSHWTRLYDSYQYYSQSIL
ncbi:kinase-like domain-containing protein [Crucibulum laeve]|uniref:1-phosphatidylinositol 4-kinase n=1 Tax=Crucibulum laeve TaxID=68775 RepID=A0A5C3MFC6_9AGAR|nr:kinase-like domain-containing protein [Crucibulum laeve]